MNHTYRLIFSTVLNTWVAVAECARGRGKTKRSAKRSTQRRAVVLAALCLAPPAFAGPQGGQVTSGAGQISQQGNTTTINQSSQNLSLTWKSFNTNANETVNFVQPSASAIAVNRILDTNGTQFLGHLNANGQVWLINPNGILFGKDAQVNVGGLVASTLDVNDNQLSSSARSFGGTSQASVVNQGQLNGRYVALLGHSTQNTGTLTADGGSNAGGSGGGMVALGAGSQVTLTFADNQLLSLRVDQSALNALADNGGLIRADGAL